MELQINLKGSKFKIILSLLMMVLLNSCTPTNVVDVNMEIPENNWLYSKSIKTVVEIKDSSLPYHLYFKIRNTADYRYSNIYVLMHLKGDSLTKSARYQFQLARANGQWIGKGSGDLYSNTFPLLKDFRFPKAGKYELEIEQNMRDNPLIGISDVGILVEKANQN